MIVLGAEHEKVVFVKHRQPLSQVHRVAADVNAHLRRQVSDYFNDMTLPQQQIQFKSTFVTKKHIVPEAELYSGAFG